MNYIQESKPTGCIFCDAVRKRRDAEHLLLYRGTYAFVVMNKFPYNNGHLMILPKRHCHTLEELNEDEAKEIFELLKLSLRVIKKTLFPQGFNIGINLGKAGGAGKDHLHFHVVPRWAGDTNFMAVFGETRVIPEYLGSTYQKLHAGFEKLQTKKHPRKGRVKT
jgi:ATP adenylyltransferase